MWLTSLTFCIVILTLWIIWRKRKLTFFRKLDIPGPPPSLLFGNYWELLHEGQHNCFKKWIEEYGRVFGYYYGLRPVLVVADVDSLRQIQVKDFQKFVNRPSLFTPGNILSKLNRNALTVVQGKRWKDLRSILTPTFTTSKLRKMSPIINEAVDELLQAVEKKSATGKPLDIYHLYQNLTMDVIARTSLGIHTNAQTNENDPFAKLARIIFSTRMDLLSMLFFSFTEICTFFASIRTFKQSLINKGRFPRREMQERTAAAIKARRSNPDYRRVDVLQLMMDTQKTGEIANDKSLTAGENEDSSINENTSNTPARSGKGMTDEEILHNATLFLMAGFETTSTALAFFTHILIYHQDVQNKVREEINRNVSADEELSYDVIYKLEYLDCVLNESLRLYPSITYFINREATEDTVINNICIPKNTAIQVPVYYLHHDPTLWEEPEIFNPERFSHEEKRNRHLMSFQPFGAGPRNCIGMRFAQMEAKMAIAKLVRKYKLLPKSGTRKEDFKISYTLFTMSPEEGVFIEVEPV